MSDSLTPAILAIETASHQCSVALLHNGEVSHRSRLAMRGTTEFVLQMIKSLLNEMQLSLDALSAIAYSAGPGSFTGIRIATAITQAIALAHRLPVIPVSSLHCLAQTAFEKFSARAVIPCVDAFNQRVYWGAYKANHGGLMQVVTHDTVSTAHAMRVDVPEMWVGVGDGWQRYAEALNHETVAKVQYLFGALLPDARALLTLATEQWQQGDTVTAAQALPVYLRDDIAQQQPKTKVN